MGAHVKKGDTVVVIAGRDKGKQGRVLEVRRETGRVVVEGVAIVKRHTKPSQQNRLGGIVDKPAPIDISNVQLLETQTGKGTRVRVGKDKAGEKTRISTRTGKVVG
jgi:large subunit ribosomal protein L24